MLRKLLIATIIILLIGSVITAYKLGIISPCITYEYKVCIVLTNVGMVNTKVDVEELYPLLILVPSIPGWQSLRSYTIYVNGRVANHIFKVKRDIDGNLYLTSDYEFTVRPKKSLNITLVQIVDVHWAPFGTTLFRKTATLSQGIVLNNLLDLKYYIMPSGLWDFNSNSKVYDWSSIKDFVSRIMRMKKTPKERLTYFVSWMKQNIAYVPPTKGVRHPTITFRFKRGACGDQTALIVSILRMMKIYSFAYIALVYDESVVGKPIISGPFQINYIRVKRHAFAMASLDGVHWFPIDTTYNSLNTPIEYSAINIRDNVIVLAQVVVSDMNKFLVIKLPEGDFSMKVTMELKIIEDPILRLLRIIFGVTRS